MSFATTTVQVADHPSAAPHTQPMQIGAFTFADVSLDPRGVGPEQRLPELVEEIALADEVGLDVFGIGEHHRPDFAAPAPVVLLAAAASHTGNGF
jgi:alkanesulfonate monooxygenase SsuD/methylene tetrahydromethanopterin reductase-like flavin-dependent oxidoreductase (luciferase family)